jgi:UDP-N-acetylglucosamine 2-epimerase (non-hydrolysing)
MHLNPNVRNAITRVFGPSPLEKGVADKGGRGIEKNANEKEGLKNTYFIEPLDYLPFVHLLNRAYLVLTDSGGIQEEAPGLGKPVLVMRNTTERPEAIDAGTVKLVGTDKDTIIREAAALIRNPETYETMAKASNPYGDGLACSRIVEKLKT